MGRQVFGQLGLDPDHAAGARKHDVQVGCTAAAESGGAFPLEAKIVETGSHRHGEVGDPAPKRREAVDRQPG